jgi:tetratricopeptide (TPR) repeat protein
VPAGFALGSVARAADGHSGKLPIKIPFQIAARARILALALGAGVLAASLAPSAAAQAQQRIVLHPKNPIRVEGSPELFTTLCALYAASVNAPGGSPTAAPMDADLAKELADARGPATDALHVFYQSHALPDPDQTLSRYVSYGLAIGAPPKFPYLIEADELPPDVLTLEGLSTVLQGYYREAHLDRQWARLQPEYDKQIAPLDGPVLRMTALVSGYLREIEKPSVDRTFVVIVEPFVGARTQFRSYGDNYSIAVGSGPNAPMADIRHAYLHFLLDGLPLRYRAIVASKERLLSFVAAAPTLSDIYKHDFAAYLAECLVKAVELRLDHLKPEELEKRLKSDDEDGLVLVRPLVWQLLNRFDHEEPAMSLYFPDMVKGIDLAAEEKRAEHIQYTTAEAAAKEVGLHERTTVQSELQTWLAEGERQIAQQQAVPAEATFERTLEKYPGVPRATYGLAVSLALQGKVAKAQQAFEQVLTLAQPSSHDSTSVAQPVDPALLAWSHVYLGRIHDAGGERDAAVAEYKAAMAVAGAPQAALLAGQQGLIKGFGPAASGKGTPKPQ